MKAACIQMCSGDRLETNLESAAVLLAQAADQGAKLALLPENFAFMGKDEEAKRSVAEWSEASRALVFLSEQARRLGIYIIGGTVALLTSKKPGIRNACSLFAPDGECLATYDKIHLFDISMPGECHQESAIITAGDKPVSAQIGDWRLGLSVCYDLRFPELYRQYSQMGCTIVSVPSAFTVPTGRAHWEVLLRARAIENQCYVLAAAQSGVHPGGRMTWGHSMVVNPWGEVLAERPEGEGLAVAEISLDQLLGVRNMLPALEHRRMI